MRDDDPIDVSVIIVSHGHEALLKDCLETLGRGLDGLEAELIVVDNLGRDGVSSALARYQGRIRRQVNRRPRGFAQNVNQAARTAVGRYLLLLNPDTRLIDGHVADAIHFMDEEPSAGVVGCRLVNPDGTFQQSYRRFPTAPVVVLRALGVDRWPFRPRFYRRAVMEDERFDTVNEVDWVLGAFMLMRCRVFHDVGGMDERFYLYYEDVDLCHRLRQRGLKTYYFPKIQVMHHWQRSSAARPFGRHWRWHVRSARRFFAKHGGMIRRDPKAFPR